MSGDVWLVSGGLVLILLLAVAAERRAQAAAARACAWALQARECWLRAARLVDAADASAAPERPAPGAAEFHAGAELYAAADVTDQLRMAPYAALVSYRENGEPVPCRNCGLPIEPATPPTSSPWQHTGTGALGCWIGRHQSGAPVAAGDARLFGLLAEPARACVECGEPETTARPLVGQSALDDPRRTDWRCTDVRACYDRKKAARV